MNVDFFNSYIIRKKLFFLINTSVDPDGFVNMGAALSNALNQNGIYENEKLLEYVKNYVDGILKYHDIRVTINFLIPILFIFPRKKQKTYIYIFSPFSNSSLNLIVRLNVIDYYLYQQFKLRNLYFISHFEHIKRYFRFYYNRKSGLIKSNLLIKNFFFIGKTKKFLKLFRRKIKFKRRILRRKRAIKKYFLKKKFNFIFFSKSKKWFNYILLFKLIYLKIFYLSKNFLYINLKNFSYSLISFISTHRRWLLKRFRRRFNFKRKFGRNKFGELMSVTRLIQTKKKKKH